MLRLLDLKKITQNLIPITTSEYFVGKSHTFHPDGLFSEKIFGAMETPDRRKNYSFIELNCRIFHPALFPILRRLEQKIIKIMKGSDKFKIDAEGKLIEDPEGEISTVNHIIDNFDKLTFRSEGQKIRSDFIDMIDFYKKKNMIFIDRLLVIPPNFRDMTIGDDGEITVNPLNDYYIKVIRHSQQLRSVGSGPMHDILVNRMNDLVMDTYNYITTKISKKSGLLRQNMLGKRIDFTARAVISGSSSELKPNQVGVPLKLLVKLFEPFLLFELLNSGRTNKEQLSSQLQSFNGSPLNAMSLKRLFIGMSKGDEIPDNLYNTLGEAIDRAIRGKVVIAKRDPALHAESVQAFEPVRVIGNTIKLHPLKCEAFNADFDGDQMALYVPITRQAIDEANDKMVVSKSKDGMGQMIDSYNKDTCIGIFVLTQNPPGKEKAPPPSRLKKVKSITEIDETNFYEWVQFGKYVTTGGRMIFNEILPDKYEFINEPVDKKLLNKLANVIFREQTKEVYNEFADKCVKLAYKFGTMASPSFSLDDLEIPKYIYDLKNKLKGSTPQEAQAIINDMEDKMKVYLETKMGNLGTIGKAGGLKGGYSQARQILIAKGLIADNGGNILPPISESYGEGFESKDFFMTGAGSRKGIADRVLNTAETGYLSRQLVYALQRLEADPRIWNCKTTRPYMIKVTPDIAKRLNGRYLLQGGKPVKIEDSKKLIGKMIPLKSPLYCRTPKICRTCYGELLLRNESPYIGMLAAQIIGERGTQLIMKSFHTGGAISVVTINIMDSVSDQLIAEKSKYFAKYFEQVGNKLVAKIPGRLLLKKSEYLDPTHDIKRTSNDITLEYGYFYLETSQMTIDLTLDTKTIIDSKQFDITEDEQTLSFTFKAGDVICECPPTTDSMLNKVKVIKHLLSGKKPFRSADHFCNKILDQYLPLSDTSDLIHFEVLACHLLRDVRNPSYPARLSSDYNAVVISLKKIPQYESWLSALSFENPSEAISTGLIYDREQSESVLEQIVNGTL